MSCVLKNQGLAIIAIATGYSKANLIRKESPSFRARALNRRPLIFFRKPQPGVYFAAALPPAVRSMGGATLTHPTGSIPPSQNNIQDWKIHDVFPMHELLRRRLPELRRFPTFRCGFAPKYGV
jgi:hypothetical protein